MGYLISLICLFFVILTLSFDKKIYNPYVLFNMWWGLTIITSSFGFFGVEVPTPRTYALILIGILSFNFSMVFILKRNQPNIKEKRLINTEINNGGMNFIEKPLLLIHILIIIILANRSLSTLELLLSGVPFSRIRYLFYYDDSIMSGYDFLINNIFVRPFTTFSIIYTSLQFFRGKNSKLLTITTLLCVFLSSFSSAGRSIILTFGIIVILSYFISKSDGTLKIKISRKILLRLMISAIFISLVYITTLRSSFGAGIESIFRTVVVYFTAPFIYLEKLLPFAESHNVVLFGGAFFGGILDVFILAFNFLGFDLNTMSSYISTFNQMPINVGGGTNYNAFPTMLYTFFYDFKFVGIIIGSFMFGFLALLSYNKMVTTNRLEYKGIYIMFVILIYESIMRWEGIFHVPWIVILTFLVSVYISNRNINKSLRQH